MKSYWRGNLVWFVESESEEDWELGFVVELRGRRRRRRECGFGVERVSVGRAMSGDMDCVRESADLFILDSVL